MKPSIRLIAIMAALLVLRIEAYAENPLAVAAATPTPFVAPFTHRLNGRLDGSGERRPQSLRCRGGDDLDRESGRGEHPD